MLNIYKASAGSGKTFTLVLEYFILIFSKPEGYKHTLAVTFTNKATEEMKLRIVEELYMLALGDGSSSYEKLLLENVEVQKAKITTKEALYSKAKWLLKAILHDYSKLSVTTIDRFFQKLIRSFLRELNQSPSYAVELDVDGVLAIAVQRVIDKIPNNPSLKKWVKGFIHNSLEKADKVNVDTALTNIGKTLFNESTMLIEKSLFAYNNTEIEALYNKAIEKVKSYEKEYKDECKSFFVTLEDCGLTLDNLTKGKSGPASLFVKGANGGEIFSSAEKLPKLFMNSVEDHKTWIPKSKLLKLEDYFAIEGAKGLNRIIGGSISRVLGLNEPVKREDFVEKTLRLSTAVTGTLINEIKQSIGIYFTEHSNRVYKLISDRGKEYNTYKAILYNLYNLGLLKSISDEMEAFCKESDTMMLHSTTKLLGELINNNDTSFIYEKMGNYYDYIMIDEFQDTSKMQWSNFKPLIENSIASGNSSLIVGDIKQSIYKFRNGDWRMLASGVKEDLRNQTIIEHSLVNNWRSYSNVVKFNNAAFPVFGNYVKNIYAEVCEMDANDENLKSTKEFIDKIENEYLSGVQEIKKSGAGKVGIYFAPQLINEKKEDAEEKILQRVKMALEEIKCAGGNMGDCAILVSRGKEASMVANKLIEWEIPFVSNESLSISNSKAIKFLIAILKYIRQPKDTPNKALLLSSFYALKGKMCPEELFFNCKDATCIKDILGVDFDIDESKISTMPLYDIVDYFISIFKLGEEKNNIDYLIAFQDIIHNYINRNNNSVSEFLDRWEEGLKNNSITLSENSNAVKIMTIHKSKGLQFRHVIIPFFTWDFYKPGETIWVNVKKHGISDTIEYVPVSCTKALLDTVFADEYKEELIRTIIDRLNVLYVAMTRAVESMYICTSYKPDCKTTNLKSSNSVLLQVISILEDCLDLKDFTISDNDKYLIYECGELSKQEKREESDSDTNKLSIDNYTAYTSGDKFVIKSTHNDFAPDNSPRTKAIDQGKLQHFIMQNIENDECIEVAIQQAVYSGLLSVVEADKYIELFTQYMNQVKSRGWFNKGTTVISEREIILKDKSSIRPDRVVVTKDEISVIDFKFGAERKEYQTQVEQYCQAISEMGYKQSVKGYLWYPNLQKIVALD